MSISNSVPIGCGFGQSKMIPPLLDNQLSTTITVALSCFHILLPSSPLLSTAPCSLLSTSHTHHKKLMTKERQRQQLRLGCGCKATLGKKYDILSTKALTSDTHVQLPHSVNQGKSGLDLLHQFLSGAAQADGINSHQLLCL